MRARDVLGLVVGSSVVYFVVAACSAYSEESPTKTTAGDGASTAPTTSPTNPVPNAMAEGYKSGSRLKLKFWEGSDGSRQWIGLFDAELKTSCSPTRGSDAKDRCLPLVQTTPVYSEATCATLIGFRALKSMDPQPTVGARVTNANTNAIDYFKLGALANPPAAVFEPDREQGGGGSAGCRPATVTTNESYYVVSDPLPLSAFVEMTQKVEP